MIKTPTDVYPRVYVDEVRRLNALPYPWLMFRRVDAVHFQGTFRAKTFISELCHEGADIAGLFSLKEWIRIGPKIARVTAEQYEALAQVEVRMELCDFTMPYSALLVELPPGLHHTCVILCLYEDTLMAQTVSANHRDDIATLLCHEPGRLVDAKLDKFDVTCQDLATETLKSLRVACNMALALTNFGYQAEYIFAKERERDLRLSHERSERGSRAAARLKEAPEQLSLLHNVKLYSREGGEGYGNSSGHEVSWHWRRGHWLMQAYGPMHSLRKRMYRMPVMVREDLAPANATEVVTRYS